jgi:hypothetical protein
MLTERRLFQFTIGRMIFDCLGVAAKTVALMQHRSVAIGEPRAFVEMTAGEGAQPIEMRFDMAKHRIRQMQPQQIRQRRVGPIEIHAGGVGRQQSGLIGNIGGAVVLEWLHD